MIKYHKPPPSILLAYQIATSSCDIFSLIRAILNQISVHYPVSGCCRSLGVNIDPDGRQVGHP